MIINKVKCEMCEESFPLIFTYSNRLPDIPAYWFTLFQGKFDDHVVFHFCSTQCMAEWIHDHPS